MHSSIHRGATLLTVLGAACAAPRRPTAAPAEVRDACVLSGNDGATADTLTVALGGTIDPAHAPLPQSDMERFLFRALYETLIRVDCAGRARPGLAEGWSSEEGGRRWTFVLRQDARFWDGEPVTAHDVVAAWAAHDTVVALAAWDGPVTQAAQVMSERVLAVRLRRPSPDVPLALAHPGLAVSKQAPGLRWSIGTGRYWVNESAQDVTAAPAFGDPLPVLRLRPLAGGDARDLLDAGLDLLATDDPATLSYVGTRSDLDAIPLPWDRTYVLVPGSPDAPGRVGRGQEWRGDPEKLAREAVRVEARAATGTPWWEIGAACAPAPRQPGPRRRSPSGRIAYPRGDAAARDLANRLVALATGRGPAAASALSMDALAGDLRAARSSAYVLALPRVVLDPCLATERLVARAPWLDPRTVVPLVEVRRRVVLRRGVPALTVDWDGTVRLAPR